MFRNLLGEHLYSRVFSLFDKIFFRANPLVQIFFVALYSAGLYIFVVDSLQVLEEAEVNNFYIAVIWLQVFTNLYFYLYCCVSDPGKITKSNIKNALEIFNYDRIIFFPSECKTCKLPKPARSKHCSMCNRCVAMYDHHCIWFNNCMGLQNYRYFLLFLASLLFLLITASSFFLYSVFKINYMNVLSKFQSRFITDKSFSIMKEIIATTLFASPYTSSLALFLLFLVPIIAFFLVYQTRLWLIGKTSNESEKWADIEDAIHDKIGILEIIEPQNQDSDDRPKILVENISMIKNMYNYGWKKNLELLVWPPYL
ncbi:hypothetical protein BB558_000312 [Smittium angustum]|uniref:Palmitoyltransferase n=1 Tax=Smittium angustum TaxID=133377 RepID=A0A2U1JEQ7_SMIAN|nr:hypothetical protein BB558_000312 [Smittium angustum]